MAKVRLFDDDHPAIQTIGLTKRYGRSVLAVDSLSMKVPRGEIFGFLGPNGAGKTTTIRMLLDLIRPTSGHAEILGMDCQQRSFEVRQQVGYLPGELNLYDNLNGRSLLELFASLHPGRVSWDDVNGLCRRLEVDLEKAMSDLSQGNRQKVGLVLAFLAHPDVIILDEPTSGLDPLVQHQVLDILREAREEGRTVFFSSHVLSEVEEICDRVGFIRNGRLVAVEEVAALRGHRVQHLSVTFSEAAPIDTFASLAGVRLLDATGHAIRLEVTGDVDPVIKAIALHHVVSLESEHPSLEEVFMAYYQGDGVLPGNSAHG